MKQNNTLTILGFLFLICSQAAYAVRLNPCDVFLMQEFMLESPVGNGGFNGHGRLKAETVGMNVDIKRTQTVPTLENEEIFQINALNVLSRIGKISLEQESPGMVKVSLKIESILNFEQKTFTAVGDYNAADGVFYVLSDQQSLPVLHLSNFKIYYYPDSMRVVLQAKEWNLPVPLRLNHPPRHF